MYYATEANPLMQWVAETFGARWGLGVVKVIITIFSGYMLSYLYLKERIKAWILLTLVVLVMLVVVLYQIHMIYFL